MESCGESGTSLPAAGFRSAPDILNLHAVRGNGDGSSQCACEILIFHTGFFAAREPGVHGSKSFQFEEEGADEVYVSVYGGGAEPEGATVGTFVAGGEQERTAGCVEVVGAVVVFGEWFFAEGEEADCAVVVVVEGLLGGGGSGEREEVCGGGGNERGDGRGDEGGREGGRRGKGRHFEGELLCVSCS